MKCVFEKAGNNFFIAPATPDAAAELGKTLSGTGFRWYFSGSDFSLKSSLSPIIGKSGEFIQSGRILQEIAHSLKAEYVEYIGSLSQHQNNPSWWYGAISEKNPFISSNFINICNVDLACRLFEEHKNSKTPVVLFIQDNLIREFVLEQLKQAPDGSTLKLLKNSCITVPEVARIRLRLAKQILSSRSASNAAFPKKHSVKNPASPITLLFSHVFPGDFDKNGNFNNHHLGNLSDYLKKNGENVAIWPFIWSPDSKNSLWQKLAASEIQVLPSETFLSASEILINCMKDIRPSNAMKHQFSNFDERDITPFLINDILTRYYNTRDTQVLIFFACLQKWKSAGINIRKIIYPFENHTWERFIIIEAKRYFPDVKIIGSQHAQLPGMLLNYFISHREQTVMPLPDRIISCGKIPAKTLRSSGYPPGTVVEGPAFRYQNLLEREHTEIKPSLKNKTRPTILIAAPIEKSVSMEIIDTCVSAFEKFPSYNILIKCHPAMRFDEIFPDGKSLPKNIIVAEDAMDTLLDKADVLIYALTTTCLEALPRNIEIMHFIPQSFLDIDPLEDVPQFKTDVVSPTEIIAAIEKYSRREAGTVHSIHERKEYLKNYFSPVNSDTIKPYLC